MIAGAILALGIFAWSKGKTITAHSNSKGLGALALAGAPLLVFNVFTSVTLRGDILLLKWLVEPALLGIYSACSALSVAVLSVSGAFKTRTQAALLQSNPREKFNREIMLTTFVSVTAAIIGSLGSPL